MRSAVKHRSTAKSATKSATKSRTRSQTRTAARRPAAPKRRTTSPRARRPALETAPPLKTVDALLDEALGDTFPASDPVALTVRRGGG